MDLKEKETVEKNYLDGMKYNSSILFIWTDAEFLHRETVR